MPLMLASEAKQSNELVVESDRRLSGTTAQPKLILSSFQPFLYLRQANTTTTGRYYHNGQTLSARGKHQNRTPLRSLGVKRAFQVQRQVAVQWQSFYCPKTIIYIFNKPASMKAIYLLLLLALSTHCHIYSSPPKVTYGYDGTPLYYSLFLALETGIGATDYLRINWAEKIHNSLKTEVVVNLISFSNNLQVATATCVSDGSADTVYHVTFGYTIVANTWYELQIYPSVVPGTMPARNLIQVLAVSDWAANCIIYDSNMAFGYVSILPTLGSVDTLGVVCNSSSSQATVPAAIYSYDIYITPTFSSSTGGNFTLSIYYDNTMTTGTTIIDFSFMGLCQSAATNAGSAAVLISCGISSDLSTITFAMSSVTANQAIRISTSVSNPVYYSSRGIKAYWTEFISGKVIQNGKQSNALQVSQIAIQTISPRVLLFWGIESTNVISNTGAALPVFSAASGSPNILVYNSFNIGFSFSQTSPITGQYIVYMKLGASAVAQGSIAHNLPAYTGTTVYCYYDTTPVAQVDKQIVCKNVGAFINTAYRYFISGKAHFAFGTTSPISTFGYVSISPVVYTNSGVQILTPQLYVALAAQPVNVAVSQQFLDLSGYHSTGTYSIGNAQVVSYYDDLSLSSTANAVQGFLQGTNSSIGIIPDLGTSQQLLFLLNTPTAQVSSGSNAASDYTINLMFNSQVIGFETSATGLGLDFVGYYVSGAAWSISGSPCYYSTVVCQKYNNATPTKNTKSIVSGASGINFYGMYNFQCGTTYTASPSPSCSTGPTCANECTMFTGYGLSNKGASLMSMRQVVLPSGFHSSIYADTNLLDFLFIFKQGSAVISYCLINGFTMSGVKLQNIKAAYVNYYDNSGDSYNKGVRIPMMVRIGGGVLPAESNGATAIGIFFDDNVDASTFYTTSGSSWSVGCSTGSCNYFPNTGVSNTRSDKWLLNRQIIIYNLPPIQNEFNILVPVTPDTTNRNPPKYLTIAFFTQNYSVWGVTGLLQTVAVYRLFGPVVTASVTGALTSINGLARSSAGQTPNIEMSSSSFALSGGFGQYLNTSNMYTNPTNNTFVASNSDSSNSFGTAFGGGYTIASFFYNIFASSTVQWNTPPANTATTCTLFGYVYNQKVGGNAYKTGQWMYIAFCPIDAAFTLSSSAANINFINPQYPLVFTNGFPLAGVLTLAYSNQYGALRAYRHQTTAISTLLRTCTTAKLQKYNPSSSGKQRSTFTLTLPAITMSASGYIGYSSFRVTFSIPSSTVSTSGLVMLTNCDTSNTLLSCTIITASQSSVVARFNYVSTGSSTITYLEVNLYATASSTFNTADSYTATVTLPQYINSNYYAPFGDTNYAASATYCSCSSSFIVGITAYGSTAIFSSLTFSAAQKLVRSKIEFNFGASSYRDAFFSTSSYVFSLGFLSNPCYTTYTTGRNNFRCLIYEGQNSSAMSLSSAWKSLTLSDFSASTLAPKAEISNPSSIIYKMSCFGGGIPSGGNTTDMTIAWKDDSNVVQTASNIAYTSITLSSAPPTTATLTFNVKRFNTAGMKALYSFAVTSPVVLNTAARFYFDFHMLLSPYLDQNGLVECYISSTSVINDTAAKYTYCAFTTWWQLMVWNNQNGSSFFIDIYNIDLPKNTDVTSNQYISVTIDDDSNYAGGVAAYKELADTSPSATIPTDFYILTTSVTSNYILSTQTLSMTIDMLSTGAFTTATSIYVLFPASYAVWNYRGQTVSTSNSAGMYCAFNKTGDATNLATSCSFISQRILQISLSAVTHQFFTLTLMNINTPPSVPSGKFNQYRFKLFLAGASQSTVSYFSFTDYSQHLTLTTNPSLVALSWNYYSLSVASSLFTLTAITDVITVQTGYYSKVIELRQSLYPSNFQATLQLAISNYPSLFQTLNPLTVNLGKPTAYFMFAATNSTSPGLYTLQFTKTGDSNSVYTNIPPLTLVVQSTLCSLSTDANTYTLPVGGMTLPIVINAISCIPTTSINLSVSFSSSQFSVNTDLSNLQLTSSTVDGQLYIIVKHVVPGSGSLVAGNSVTATISITGTNSAFYALIPTFTLTLVDATTFQTFPTGTALTAPTLSGNKATFQLQCSQSSRIYWGIGLYPSILNNAQVDFEARIISARTGLATNFTQSNDYYARVYGVLRGTTMQVTSQTLYNLQSNVNYIFKYFCVNQVGHVSDSQSINFTSSNYGAYLMKVEITFRGSITYGQYNNLACSLAQNFIIPYTRVLTQAASSCGSAPYILYANDSAVVLNQPDSNGWYIYGFYIQPDYSNANDQTNANIRNQLSISTQATTIITSTTNYITLPSLVQMQTTDIQIYTTPAVTISSPVSGLTSVAVTALITNMNGFIVMGVMAGSFNSSTMTIPSASNIKSGKFSSTQSLSAVQMIHTTQNYNTSFQFSGLSANTLYTFFYFCTVEDPGITALSSSVSTFSAQTLQMLVININFGLEMSYVWGLALLLLAVAA